MKISADKFTLECSYEELWKIASSVLRYVTDEEQLKKYWSQFEVDTWLRNSCPYMDIAKEMFCFLGQQDVYHWTMTDAETKLRKLIEERKQQSKHESNSQIT